MSGAVRGSGGRAREGSRELTGVRRVHEREADGAAPGVMPGEAEVALGLHLRPPAPMVVSQRPTVSHGTCHPAASAQAAAALTPRWSLGTYDPLSFSPQPLLPPPLSLPCPSPCSYRVQHNNSRGPYKGGLRYHPQVDLDDVRRWEQESGTWEAQEAQVTVRLLSRVSKAMLSWVLAAKLRCNTRLHGGLEGAAVRAAGVPSSLATDVECL